MPSSRSRQPVSRAIRSPRKPAIAVLMVGVIAALSAIASAADSPTAVRSRDVELHYRLGDAGPRVEVELWYTRDRGATWHRYGIDEDRRSPLVFTAPAEGLYGFILIVRDGQRRSSDTPRPFQPPQRWVFVDYTPPLVQWDGVEPAEDFAARRVLHLRWTSHDDNFPSRPVALAYQSSIDQTWHTIDAALPELARYDWAIPADVTGQLTLKLTVRDLGGQVVERLQGPLPIQRWLSAVARLAATQPAPIAASQPAAAPQQLVNLVQRRKTEELYQQGGWHLARGQYEIAAERFREALEIDPDCLPAMNDLGGIYYQQKDYAKALEQYRSVLVRDGGHVGALRGMALAHVGRKEYAQSRDALQRLLSANKKDAEAWLDLGDVLFMMGDGTDARSHWSRAAEVDHSAEAVIRKARRRLELYGTVNSPEPVSAVSRR